MSRVNINIGNIKVMTKLIGGFLIVCAVAVVIGVFGIKGMAVMNDDADDLLHRGMGGVNASQELVTDILHMSRSVRNMVILHGDETSINSYQEYFAKNYDALKNWLDSLENMATLAETKTKIADVRKEADVYERNARLFMAAADKAKYDVPSDIIDALRSLRVSEDAVENGAAELLHLFEGAADDIKNDADATYKSTRGMLLALLILGVILGVSLGVALTLHISRPVTALSNMITEWRHGRLAMRLGIKNRGDELGVMAQTADGFADDFQNVIFKWLTNIKNGDLNMDIVPRNSDDEIGTVFRDLVKSLRSILIDDGGRVLRAAARNDLTQRIDNEYPGVFGSMRDDINTVVNSLDDAMSQVAEAVEQVSAASGQIASGAQSLAEGANTQASSLEEISSSLEEMSSMTKQNADNSSNGKAQVESATEALSQADESMRKMADAIHSIKASSDNTSKILKTIDDIAFQTNLLALNAAVEAARAGEAGKGFAVVAEEVRNLAMRSAEASKSTADMIEESVKSADLGVKISEDVAKHLSDTVERAGKLSGLISEIATASNEQALGVEQVNKAVAQMNDVTQQNAANSEESASAAEELSSQAAELATMVSTFKLSDRTGGAVRRSSAPKRPVPFAPRLSSRQPVAAIPDRRAADTRAADVTRTVKAVDAETIVPLDDDELSEF